MRHRLSSIYVTFIRIAAVVFGPWSVFGMVWYKSRESDCCTSRLLHSFVFGAKKVSRCFTSKRHALRLNANVSTQTHFNVKKIEKKNRSNVVSLIR